LVSNLRTLPKTGRRGLGGEGQRSGHAPGFVEFRPLGVPLSGSGILRREPLQKFDPSLARNHRDLQAGLRRRADAELLLKPTQPILERRDLDRAQRLLENSGRFDRVGGGNLAPAKLALDFSNFAVHVCRPIRWEYRGKASRHAQPDRRIRRRQPVLSLSSM